MHDVVKNVVLLNEARLVDAARLYAAADKSDPFTFNRCLAHIRQGLCRPIEKDGSNGHYEAQQVTISRPAPDGSSYIVLDYQNVKRL